MERWGVLERVRFGALQCAGLGLVAGGMEVVYLSTTLRLPLSWLRFLLLGATDLAVMSALSALAGLGVGALVHLLRPDEERDLPVLLAGQTAGCALLLTGYYLWQGAIWTWIEGQQPIGAAAMAAMPVGFAGVVYFNARFWFRRMAAERTSRASWLIAAAAAGGVLCVGSAVAYANRDTGGRFSLEGDANLVLVTVDGLRHDQIGAAAAWATPALDALARDAVVFDNAVTPSPGSRAANATVLVGLHPLRHRVLGDRDILSRAYRSLFEVLASEGWATGGFVSDRIAEAGSGLDQGFLVFDDDFFPALAGIARINLVGHVLDALPAGRAALDRRGASATTGRFEAWLGRHHELPFAAWVHLSDPHHAAVSGGDVAEAVAAVDDAVARIGAALGEAGVAERTLVVVAGTHGELLGAHGGQGNHSLYDEVVRVPLLIRAPGLRPEVPRIEAQVRLMDLANTALDWLKLDPMDESEGIVLTPYGLGQRRATIWCALVGQTASGEWLLGMRNNGLKYVRHADGTEELYNVDDDPGEVRDLVEIQTSALISARTLLASDAAAMARLIGAGAPRDPLEPSGDD
ncbi:MAG TPA: hypothetical protein ENK18_14885 [Deltaproteobacteria bacterium]|nr:hypothetical protein [Deltaproteobacteria bacterium]